jgi:hypothetical protein
MAYDQKRDKIILYGGESGGMSGNSPEMKFSDTWEWDGTQWWERTGKMTAVD